MAYDHQTLKQTAVFNTSPDAGEAGIWQTDNAPAADELGNIYAATGNGKFTASAGGRDYGDTLLKLGVERGHLVVDDYFTPSDQAAMNAHDQDLGSGGPILLPDQPGPHPHLVLIGGKNGTLFMLDRDRLGHYQTRDNNTVVQQMSVGKGIYSAPAYWNGHADVLANENYLLAFALDRGRFSEHASQESHKLENFGGTPTVSANGVRNGIVWLIETKAWNDADRPAVLHAYDASNVAREIYNSEEKTVRAIGRERQCDSRHRW